MMNKIEKIEKFKTQVLEVIKLGDEKELKHPIDYRMYQGCKNLLREMLEIIDGKREVKRPQTQSTSLGLMSTRLVRDVDPEYADLISTVSWNFDECFDIDDENHVFVKKGITTKERQEMEKEGCIF